MEHIGILQIRDLKPAGIFWNPEDKYLYREFPNFSGRIEKMYKVETKREAKEELKKLQKRCEKT